MTESEQLTEGSYVYTDLGIEQVHWCEVNGEKELVTPKGKVLDKVPTYDDYISMKRLVADSITYGDRLKKTQELELEARKENAQLKELLKECRKIMLIEKDFASCHFEKDKLGKLCEQITEVLGDK